MAEERVKRNNRQAGRGYSRHAVVIPNHRITRNYTWLAGLVVIVLMGIICSAMYKASQKAEEKNASYDLQIAALQTQLEEQEQRREELDVRSVYITTKQFIEEFAKEKLGLVYDDELIFRPEEE